MKRILLTLILGVIACGSAYAQQPVYDSLRNFVGRDVQQYVGQVLFLKENDAAKANNGYYQRFAKEPNFDLAANGRNVFKGVAGKDATLKVSDYGQMAGHYFQVLSVITRAGNSARGSAVSHFLEIADMQTGEVCYATYLDNSELSFSDFVVMGYYQKLHGMIGRSFVYTGKGAKTPTIYAGLHNAENTSELLNAKADTEWTVTDIAIEEGNDRQVIAILENPLYGKAFTRASDLVDNSAEAKFQTHAQLSAQAERARKAEEERIAKNAAKESEAIQKFGQEYGTLLAKGELKEGMTKDMCLWLLGSPLNTIKASDSDVEQWHYISGRYLYFKGNVLTKHTKVEAYKDDTNYYHNSAARK